MSVGELRGAIERATELAAEGREDRGLDVIFDAIDNALLDGQFSSVDELLAGLDPADLTVTLSIGVLCITLAAVEHLPTREVFCAKLRERLERDEPERVERLLRGLERRNKSC